MSTCRQALLSFLLALLVAGSLDRGLAAADTPVGGPLLDSQGIVVDSGSGQLPPGLRAGGWLVADAGSGDILAARNPHGRYLPASTIKTLTALTELGRLDLNRVVRPNPVDLIVDGNKAPLNSSASYRVRDLFTYLLLSSANDAANVIADVDGGRANTLARMAAKARLLQANDTHASTPSGLDAPGETTSAYDLALFARAGLSEPDFARIVSSKRASVTGPTGAPIVIHSQNRLLTLYPGAIGVKTGYTAHAQGTFMAVAHRGGRTIIVTLLHATPHYYPEAERLLDWGFSVDGHVRPVGELVAPLRSSNPPDGAGRGGPAGALQGPMSGPTWVLYPLAGLALLLGATKLRAARARRRSHQR